MNHVSNKKTKTVDHVECGVDYEYMDKNEIKKHKNLFILVFHIISRKNRSRYCR